MLSYALERPVKSLAVGAASASESLAPAAPHSYLGELADVAAIVTALIALLALALAWHQLRVMRREGRLTLAKTIYREYLAMAIDNPMFSSASYPLDSPQMYTFWNDSDTRERYEFYVAHLLFTAEEILALSTLPEWRAAMQLHLQYHGLYIATDDARLDLYSEEVGELARAAILAYNEERSSSPPPQPNR